jgi:hypothetical protein
MSSADAAHAGEDSHFETSYSFSACQPASPQMFKEGA